MANLGFPGRKLVSQSNAAMIESARVPRSKFINTFGRITAFDAGYLVPFLVDEILPGDHVTYDVTAYIRIATLLFPSFSNQRVDTFFFYTPSRIVWTNWVKMMGEQVDPDDSIAYTTPVVALTVGGEPVGSLFDHMGVPPIGQIDPAGGLGINALPFRMYNKIYNQWFRDENLQDSAVEFTGNAAPDQAVAYNLLRRAKSHDYFTSALPWPQKFTAPLVPIGGLAPVIGLGAVQDDAAAGPINVYETETGHTGTTSYQFFKQLWDPAGSNQVAMKMNLDGNYAPAVFADLSQATGVAINTLRQAWMVQSLLERDARGGTRYTEILRSHFGVVSPDARLQRPEYIGGGQSPLQLTPVAQTAPTDDAPLGALGAAGTAVGRHHASYAATEHGFVIGIINVRSELTYQQGLHRMYTRSSRYEYYWPELAGLGEQVVRLDEIYCRGTAADDDAWAYQERWHEYRTRYSDVTGIMRSTAANTIDQWHLGQKFATPPVLGPAFIVDNPPMARVLAAGDLAAGQQYLADININRTIVRAMPMYGTPVTLGRF